MSSDPVFTPFTKGLLSNNSFRSLLTKKVKYKVGSQSRLVHNCYGHSVKKERVQGYGSIKTSDRFINISKRVKSLPFLKLKNKWRCGVHESYRLFIICELFINYLLNSTLTLLIKEDSS